MDMIERRDAREISSCLLEFPWPVKEFTPCLTVGGSDGTFEAQVALDQCCPLYVCF